MEKEEYKIIGRNKVSNSILEDEIKSIHIFSAKAVEVSSRFSSISQNFHSKLNRLQAKRKETNNELNLPQNEVTTILKSNQAFSKLSPKADEVLRKKNLKNIWQTSIFVDDYEEDLFSPKLRNKSWNDVTSELKNDKETATETIAITEYDKQNTEINQRANEEDKMIRSTYSLNRPLEPLTEEIKGKYFGETAKQQFYDTYHEIYHQSKVLVGGITGVESMLGVFDDGNILNFSALHLTQVGLLTPPPGMNPIPSFCSEHEDDHGDNSTVSSWGIRAPSTFSPSKPKSRQASSIHSKSMISHTSVRSASTSSIEKHKSSSLPRLPSLVLTKENKIAYEDDFSYLNRSSYSPNSPRATFLIGCLRNNLPPRALVVLRNKLTTTLDLSHLGLGDELVILLSKALADLPALEVINLNDNNLQDIGLEAIVNSINQHNGIVQVDLSSNKIGPKAAKALGNYIGRADCHLIGLYLSNADIEDSEFAQFVENLMHNRILQDLDLSKNILGKDENLSLVIPSTITAGSGLARLLRDGRCPLRKLNVYWNMIRMEGALDLCDSIRSTTTLIYLNLSFNSIGRHGCTVLGSSLFDNHGLEELILSNNSIDAIGAFTLVVGAKENKTLRYLDLDGNPIGEQGGRMLMKLSRFHGTRIKFSALRCDVAVRLGEVIFKINEPVGMYELDLSLPYHRAVAIEILDVVALDPTLSFKYFEYSPNGKSYQKLKLERFREKLKIRDEETTAELELLKTIASISKDTEVIERVFKVFDKDGSGELDAVEFQFMLHQLGFNSSEEKVAAIMSNLDTDGGDVINLDECTEYLYNVGKTATAQIKEIESYPAFKIESETGLNPSKFIVPIKGKLRLEIQESLQDGDNRGCYTKQQVNSVIEAVDRTSNPSLLLNYALELTTFYLDEAAMIFNRMMEFEDIKVFILSKIIPRMATTLDANSLVKIHLGNESKSNKHLKKSMGMSYQPLLGMFNGYYVLDLVKESDRVCLYKLIEQSTKNKAYRQQVLHKWDISQNGNWTCFRNVRKDGKLIHTLQAEKYAPMPKIGKLEFDFIDISRPNHEVDRPIQDSKFISILEACYLLKSSQQVKQFKLRLKQLRYSLRYSLGEFGQKTSIWMPDTSRMLTTFDYLNRMYKNLDKRYDSYEKSFLKEAYAERVEVGFEMEELKEERIETKFARSDVGSENNTSDYQIDTQRSEYTREDIDQSEVDESQLSSAHKLVLQRRSSLLSILGPSFTPRTDDNNDYDEGNANENKDIESGKSIKKQQSFQFQPGVTSTKSSKSSKSPKSPQTPKTLQSTRISNSPVKESKSLSRRASSKSILPNINNANAGKPEMIRKNSILKSPGEMTRRKSLLKSPSPNSSTANVKSNESPTNRLRRAAVLVNNTKLAVDTSKSPKQGTLGQILKSSMHNIPAKSQETTANMTIQSEKKAADKLKSTKESRRRFERIFHDPTATSEFRSTALLQYLIPQLSSRWITAPLLSLLLELFVVGSVPKTMIGSYRVELIVVLFGRILDLQNFHMILCVLTAEEHAAVLARIGWLSIFNPCRPGGVYRLDLSRWEERQVAKMLIHLSVVEPGQNWHDETYTFANQTESMPGWTLTVVWYTENGLPKQGILQLRVFSGDGMGISGCRVDMKLRRMLLQLVLVDGKDLELDFLQLRDDDKLNEVRRVYTFDEHDDIERNDSDDILEIEGSKQIIRDLVKNQIVSYISYPYTLQDISEHLTSKTQLTWNYFTTFIADLWKRMLD